MSSAVDVDRRIGSEIAGYRIERLLAWGAFSVVYLAQDSRLDCWVALRVLEPGYAAGAAARARLIQQVELAGMLFSLRDRGLLRLPQAPPAPAVARLRPVEVPATRRPDRVIRRDTPARRAS
jgi:hypothetical protein